MDGADFGFVGEAYAAPNPVQDAQVLLNWYIELDPTKGAKMPTAMLGCPGLNALFGTQQSAVRGAWVLPGGQLALIVTGNTVYLATITAQATQTALPQFSVKAVGTLLTSRGPVVIRDNGVLFNGFGGYSVIVDGTYAYYYLLGGIPYSFSFTGGVTTVAPANIITLASLPIGLLVASTPTLSDTSGFIPANTTITAVDTNLLTITMSNNATGINAADTITLTIPVFGQITDAGFVGADRIAFIEGWLIFNQPNTRTFYTTGPTPYSMLFPGSFFSLKDSSTDNLITLEENNRELWLIGERTSEVWYNAGGANFAFQRLPGVGPQIGCAAVHSIARTGSVLCWLGKNEQGENLVVAQSGYSWERISTHAIEHAISQYPYVSDCIGIAYEEEGHLFYMLIFPTADATWVFDFTSKAWHQRASYDPNAGLFHRFRGNCFIDFGNIRMVGDYISGYMMQMSRKVYADNYGIGTAPLISIRRTPHVWKRQSRERVFFNQLQIEFTPGVGVATGQGADPQAMLRWQDDYGQWSNQYWTSIGKVGNTRNRAIWRLLGRGRDRVWEVQFSDPTNRDIIGATLEAA